MALVHWSIRWLASPPGCVGYTGSPRATDRGDASADGTPGAGRLANRPGVLAAAAAGKGTPERFGIGSFRTNRNGVLGRVGTNLASS